MTGAPVVVDDDDTQRVTGADDDDTQRVMTGTAADDDDDDDTERPTDTSTTASIPPLFTDSIDADAPLFNCSAARMVCACVDDPHPIVRQASSVCERTRRAAPSLTFAARLASLPADVDQCHSLAAVLVREASGKSFALLQVSSICRPRTQL